MHKRITLLAFLLIVLLPRTNFSLLAQNQSSVITPQNAADIRPFRSFFGYREGYFTDVRRAILSPDDSILLMATDFELLQLWNTATGEQILFSATWAPFFLERAEFTQDNRLLAFGNYDFTQVWEIEANKWRFDSVGLLSGFSPNGQRMLTRISDLIYLWDTESGQQLQLFEGFAPQFSSDNQWLLWHGIDKRIHIWDVTNNSEHLALDVNPTNAAFSPDSQTLATLDLDDDEDAIHFWNVTDGELLETLTVSKVPVADEERRDYAWPKPPLVFSPDGRWVAGGSERQFYIVDATTKTLVDTIGEKVNNLKFNADSSFLLAYYAKYYTYLHELGAVLRWDVATRTTHDWPIDEDSTITDIKVNSAGTLLLIEQFNSEDQFDFQVGYVGSTHFWAIATWEESAILPGRGYDFSPSGTVLTQKLGNVVVLYGVDQPLGRVVFPAEIVPSAVSLRAEPLPDSEIISTVGGDVLVSGVQNGYMYVASHDGWVIADTAYIKLSRGVPVSLLPELEPEQAIAYAPTPIPTWTPPPTSTISLTPLPTATARPIATVDVASLPTPPNDLMRITGENMRQVRLLGVIDMGEAASLVSHDGSTIAVIPQSPERPVEVWDLYSMTLKPTPPLNEQARASLALSPDGTLLAYADGMVARVWNLDTGHEVAALAGHTDVVTRMAFNPHNDQLATWAGQRDRSVRLWNLETGEQQHNLEFPFETLDRLKFSASGTKLIASGDDRGVYPYIWDAESGELLLALNEPRADVVFNADESLIASFSAVDFLVDVRVRELTSGKVLGAANPSTWDVREVVFSPDGYSMVLVKRLHDSPPEIEIWDFTRSVELYSFYRSASDIALSLDGSLPYVLSNEGSLGIFSPASRLPVSEIEVGRAGQIDLSPDGALLAAGSVLVDLEKRVALPISGNFGDSSQEYGRDFTEFSADGSTLIVSANDQILVFGVPTGNRLAWQPIAGQVKSTGINVRAAPGPDSPILGIASGEVLIGGTNNNREAFYLPEFDGWVRADYVDLGTVDIRQLPIIISFTR